MVTSASRSPPNTTLQRPEFNQEKSLTQLKDPRKDAAVGASAAGVRALSSQVLAFYFRAPVKAFFRTRVDYLAFARAINPRVQANQSWSWHMSTPGLLAHAVRTYGWGFIPNQILPPMLANIGVGAVLYTSYLQMLGALYELSSRSLKRVSPPPPLKDTFTAGFSAGAIQSFVAAPLDALHIRFDANDVLTREHKNMWQYGRIKLNEIGLRGVFAGWGLSLLKDSFGYGVFFATFEYVKAQSYYAFVTRYYGRTQIRDVSNQHPCELNKKVNVPTLKPHYAIEPAFLMLAGVAASISQQTIQHPLNSIQIIYHRRLQSLDMQAQMNQSRSKLLNNFYQAYKKTYTECSSQARRSGGWRRWFYRGFFRNTIKQVPSTSAGLVIFELVRRRYGNESELTKIEMDGYDILIS